MHKAHQSSSRFTLTYDNHYRGYPLPLGRGPYICEYLDNNQKIIDQALSEYPRALAIRVDLHIPYGARNDGRVISRFFESLKSQVRADYLRRTKQKKRKFESTPWHLWVKEKESAINYHYHVLIILSNDAYKDLGDFSASEGNVAARIKKAWASALGWPAGGVARFVHFPASNPAYKLDRNSPGFDNTRLRLLTRVAYFAKLETKDYQEGRMYGGSLSR